MKVEISIQSVLNIAVHTVLSKLLSTLLSTVQTTAPFCDSAVDIPASQQ